MPFGAGATVTGSTNTTYTVTTAPDYGQLGYSLGLAIRRIRDRKADQKLLAEAQSSIATWEQQYFKGGSPLIPSENRAGLIRFWTGSSMSAIPPFTVVLFLTNPRTQRDESYTFLFGEGAEGLKAKIEAQSPPSTQAVALTTGTGTSSSSGRGSRLVNGDVLEMLKAGLSAEIIIAKIKGSPSAFDTSPSALKQLKVSGVPDAVILAMVQGETK
jgi:hypothetical protein